MNRNKTWAALALGMTILAACSETAIEPTSPATTTQVSRKFSVDEATNVGATVTAGQVTVTWNGTVGIGYKGNFVCASPKKGGKEGICVGSGASAFGAGNTGGIMTDNAGLGTYTTAWSSSNHGDWMACVREQNAASDADNNNDDWSCFGVPDAPPPPTCSAPNHIVNGECVPCDLPNHWTPGAGDTWTCSPPTQQEKSQNATLAGGSMVYGAGALSFTRTLSLEDGSDPRGVAFSVADGASGGCTIASQSGHNVTVTFTGIGSCTILALMNDTIYFNSTTLENDHWSITGADAEFSVTPASLTITASSHALTYGDAVPTVTASYSAFAYSETSSVLTFTPACSTDYLMGSAAGGAYSTSCTGAASDGNYNITYVPGTVTVGKAPLVITAQSFTIWNYQPIPACVMSFATFVAGDDSGDLPGLNCPTPTAAGIGVYNPSGASNTNYAISYVKGDLTILKCALSQGYWKNHGSEWASTGLVSLFGRTTQATWLTLWNTSVNGNGYMQLAYQFGAAYLNRNVKGSSWNPATQAATEAAYAAALVIVASPMPVAPTKPAKNAAPAVVAAYNTALAAYTAGSNNAFAVASVLEAWNAQAPSHCAGTI